MDIINVLLTAVFILAGVLVLVRVLGGLMPNSPLGRFG